MRLVLAMVMAGLVASPQSASAQAREEGASAEPSGKQPAQPTPSRLERWHPEAFVDPSKPASEPALKLEVDSTALGVTPIAPPTLEELERQENKRRRRAIGIGVGVTFLIVGVVAAVGAAAATASIRRSFD